MFWKRGKIRDRAVAYKHLFGTEFGDQVLYDLMEYCHMLKPTSNDKDEGKREVILYILYNLNIDIALLDKKIKQKVQEESKDEFKEIDFSNTY